MDKSPFPANRQRAQRHHFLPGGVLRFACPPTQNGADQTVGLSTCVAHT
ncbi:MAG: hypothetical protein IPJ07_20045 [Acidobacteria bacterium]|nr:hypothetical protein [Acidobacteriota bacterium]MBK9705848.1 hypothetical protein [Acidobacteriota bacterium]